MSKKLNTMLCTFQVYIDGEPVKKYFKVANRTSLWSQYNSWAKKQGGVRIEDDNYLGQMAWQLPKGIAEVREVLEERQPI